MTTLALNDQVTWTSQAGGRVTQKVGRVVYVPMASSPAPWKVADQHFAGHRRMFEGNRFRPGSVLVEVASTGRAKSRLYMPWPGTLQKVT